ncbi:MAG: SH3 domain-containing protein [bacterium]
MKIWAWFLVMAVLAPLSGGAADGEKVRVAGEHVNLRVRPVADSEVVAQADEGAVLTVLRSEGDWVAVPTPTNASVWVKAEFVKDGVVLSERLNIRCGPGLSYRDVGVVRRGERLVIAQTRGDWLRILPPDGLVLWVSRSLVAPVSPVGPVEVESPPVEVAVGATTGTVTGVEANRSVPVAVMPAGSIHTLPDGVTADRLAPVLGQGAVIERQGIMERVPLAFMRGVAFRLVDRVEGRKTTVCYVRGEEPVILALLGRRCAVKGRGYWLNGEPVPLIYADSAKPGSESP